jgi:hypothetical protein
MKREAEGTAEVAKTLVAKKLRTGEIAVWDDTQKAIILIGRAGPDGHAIARIIHGSTLKALEAAMGDVVVLV